MKKDMEMKEEKTTKKSPSPMSPFSICSFFGNIVPYPKDDFH
jgi:hypothetical protein